MLADVVLRRLIHGLGENATVYAALCAAAVFWLAVFWGWSRVGDQD